jgi:phosphocarrier protein
MAAAPAKVTEDDRFWLRRRDARAVSRYRESGVIGDGEASGGTADSLAAAPLTRELPILNKRGLHARASAKFVACVDRFNAQVKVSRCGETVDGTSIMGLMMLAAGIGTTITVEASGPEARAALDAVAALVADRFGEGE